MGACAPPGFDSTIDFSLIYVLLLTRTLEGMTPLAI